MGCVHRTSHSFRRSPRRTFLGCFFTNSTSTINVPRSVCLDFVMYDSICGGKYRIIFSKLRRDTAKITTLSPLSRKDAGSDRDSPLGRSAAPGGASACAGGMEGAGAVRRGRHAPCPLAAQGAG